MTYEIIHSSIEELLPTLRESCFDAVFCDPPYGYAFMGKKWDYDVPSVACWKTVFRVLKPGGHLMAFSGARTQHRMAINIEDAGFELRDCLMWLYAKAMPKSQNVGFAIDKYFGVAGEWPINKAKEWAGYGTALKPNYEPIILARKPLIGNMAENVIEHGCGGLNIDGCRVGSEVYTINTWDDGAKPFGGGAGHEYSGRESVGRWPGNVLTEENILPEHLSRFFYSAKVNTKERRAGCEHIELTHPTMKPLELCRYLATLIQPPSKGRILVPFAGAGSEMIGASLAGWNEVLGIEQDAGYVEIAEARLKHWTS